MNKNKKKWNILIFPGGTENGIEIYKSLKYCKEINLFSASSDVPNQAFYLYKKNNIISDIRAHGWIEELNKVITKNKIDLIYPANSVIIDHLSANKEKINTDILLPEQSILELTRSKKQTIKCLKDTLSTPEIYESIDQIKNYPVFIKPDKGYGAQGAKKIHSKEEINYVNLDEFIVQEYLPGKEYTIDCFSNKHGKLLFSGGRERSRIRMATSMHAEIIEGELQEKFMKIANKILSKITITGAWFFQLKEDKNNNLKLLEIDIRIAGTMGFNRCRGVNFSMLSIFQHYGYDVSILTNDIHISLDRCLHNRYIFNYDYETAYVDLDDTIIIHNKINLDLIYFLYQCINKRIKVVLISKSLATDKEKYLKKWKISELFDEKIWLKENDHKYNYIKHEKAIYIDDSFSQRAAVSKKNNIPTFDTSMLEVLIDDRG